MLAGLLASAGPASTDFSGGLPPERVVPGRFEALAAEVRAALEPGGRHAGLDAERRAALESALDAIARLLAGRRDLDGLNPDQQVALVNAWQLANAALGPGDFDPIVCRREVPTGSKPRKPRCAHRSGLAERARLEREGRHRGGF